MDPGVEMKIVRWTAIAFVILIFLRIVGIGGSLPESGKAAKSPPENAPVAEEVRPTAAEQKALAIIKAEPKVKDVLFQPGQAVAWMVGVLPDASPDRIGYGQYICQQLKDAGAARPGTQVRIVDIVKLTREGASPREASLGTVDCSTFSRSSLP